MLQINPFLDCTVCTEIVVHIVRNNQMDELNRVMAIPVKVRKQTIWVRTDIPPNAQNLMKAIGMRIPPKILQKSGNVVAPTFF